MEGTSDDQLGYNIDTLVKTRFWAETRLQATGARNEVHGSVALVANPPPSGRRSGGHGHSFAARIAAKIIAVDVDSGGGTNSSMCNYLDGSGRI